MQQQQRLQCHFYFHIINIRIYANRRFWTSNRGEDIDLVGSGHFWGQCSGSMTFWCGSGSADPCLWLIFVIDLRVANKKYCFLSFSAYYFLKVHLHHFSKVFHTIFAWWSRWIRIQNRIRIHTSWLVDQDPGGPKTCGSGSGTLFGGIRNIR